MVKATEAVDGRNAEHGIVTTDSTMGFVNDPYDKFLSMERGSGQDVESYQLKVDDNNDKYLVRMSAGPEEEDQSCYIRLNKVGRVASALDMNIEGTLKYMDWWFCTNSDSSPPVGMDLVGEGWFLIAPVNIGPDGVSDPAKDVSFKDAYTG